MRTINHHYQNTSNLLGFIAQQNIPNSTRTLIQVFCGTDDQQAVKRLLETLKSHLGQAHIIGASTAGEIADGKTHERQILLSFSVFETTVIRTDHVPETNYQNGRSLASSLVTPTTKAIICFSESLNGDPESFIQGISNVAPSVPLAGGNAADNNHFHKTYLILGHQIYESGSVAASLSGNELRAANAYSLNWLPVGREFTVTRAVSNRIYELNQTPITEICRKYLGEGTVRALPASIIEFPLIKDIDRTPIARSIVAVHEDGSFQYAGNFTEGDRVRFSVGNVDAVMEGATTLQHQISQYPAESIYIYSCTVRKLFLKDTLQVEFQALERLAPTCGFFTYGEYYHTQKNNQILNITTTALVLSESDRTTAAEKLDPLESKVTTTKTLTHLVNTTQLELERTIAFLDQYKKAVDESAIISKTDLNGVITYVNDRFCALSGYKKNELIGQKHNIVRHPDMPRSAFRQMWKTIQDGGIWRGIVKNLKKDGSSYYVDALVMPLRDENGIIHEYISIRHDISRIMLQEQQIKRQATDELTGLPNRIQLLDDIKLAESPTLVILDIDAFTAVNELYGTHVGDQILVQVGERLAAMKMTGRFQIYRVANDVFALLHSGSEPKLSEELTCILQQQFEQPFFQNDFEIHLSSTCGIAEGKGSLFWRADMALHIAKDKRLPAVTFHEALLDSEKQKQNALWLKKLREALQQERIEPFFQPIVDNVSGEITKYEALIRLISIDQGPVSPFFFLDVAKKAKLYPHLTRIMAQKALPLLKQVPVEITLNLSVEDVLNPETIAFILDILSQHDIDGRFVLEITESEGFENLDEVLALTQKIKQIGGKIAIDDFGSGYSNFSYLLKLKPDYLKIDGSLVKNIDRDPSARAIVETIIAFAQKLQIKTIAEYVHSQEIFQLLKELGADYSQGFWLGEPLPATQCFPHLYDPE
ncbi:MAG: EAL domain-containing protein [Desulfuromonadaceae bacterium]|nr:EAL domain-containing protein [Desulfuromonadaceae bacterium]